MKAPKPFHQIGQVTDHVDVELSFQILGLFSEGQYTSPNKAVEELVSNAFDADATKVELWVSDDLAGPDASVAVIDNGVGMDPEGLKIHWLVGASPKSDQRTTAAGRTTIGKFGIGKLAAYVLGNRLTHISRVGDEYHSTTMDFRATPQTVTLPQPKSVAATPSVGSQGTTQHGVRLDIRSLSAAEAEDALRTWLPNRLRRHLSPLFGKGSPDHWTVAVISDLKPMAQSLQEGRLKWLLSTAMPLRPDFKLLYNGKAVAPAKLGKAQVGRWVLGERVKSFSEKELRDLRATKTAKGEWALNDKLLGPISGYLEVFEDPIDTGKSELIGRSNGFFVYVYGRLINVDDVGFGIDRNSLRHGTFSRFRLIINIDRLDNELRSSRETLRNSESVRRAKDILMGLFNFARSRLNAYYDEETKTKSTRGRLADSPASLGQRPLIGLIVDSFRSSETMRYTEISDATRFATSEELTQFLEKRVEEGSSLVTSVDYADMGVNQPIVSFAVETGVLAINLEHPFVAYFADDFGRKEHNMALQLVALSEVLLEANMHRAGIGRSDRLRLLDDRDDLLRWLARSNRQRNSLTIAQDLLNAESSKQGLEDALVAAFNQLGFEAVPKGGGNNPDGLAEAPLAGVHGARRSYRVSLEAKSKESAGAKVSKSGVEVATIARHRDDNECQHAVVVGPDFATRAQEDGALISELRADREHSKADETHSEDRGITVIRIRDLARLVRNAPVKRVSLAQIRKLFERCITPNESGEWIDAIVKVDLPTAPYREILEVVWEEQTAEKSYSVSYDALMRLLRERRHLRIDQPDLQNYCIAVERMAPNLFWAREDSVELDSKPEIVLDTIVGFVGQVAQSEELQGV